MFKRKMGQASIENSLKNIEDLASKRYSVPVLFIGINDDGYVTLKGKGLEEHIYENIMELYDSHEYEMADSDKTTVIINDMPVLSDSLYFPSDPIMYFLSHESRRDFIGVSDEEWLSEYLELLKDVERINPDAFELSWPCLDYPIITDLMKNCDMLPMEELLKRYRDKKWFMQER